MNYHKKGMSQIIHYRMPIEGYALCYALSWRGRLQSFKTSTILREVTCRRCLHSLRINFNVNV